MRIAITGSTGLIGAALTDRLTAAGHTVVPVRRGEAGHGGVTWRPDEGWIQDGALEGCDAVVHLGGASIGEGRWTAKRRREIHDSRIGSTRLLVDHMASLERRPQVFVCASAVGYYGDRGDTALREEAEPGTGFLAGVVREWEQEAARAAGAGIRVVSVRTSVVLAPRGGALQRMLTPFRLGLGGRLGSGRQWMPWITVEDEARAIEWVLTHDDLDGPVNLAARNPVTNRELTRALGRQLHRPTLFPVPGLALRVLLGEMANELLLQSQRVVPSKLERSGFRFKHPTIDVALAAVLGGQSRSGEVATAAGEGTH